MIEGGKVHYNGQRCKPSKVVEPGATIRLAQGSDEKVVVVLALSDKRLAAPLAQQLYQETAESLAERERMAQQRRYAREPALAIGHGRPTKRGRRELDEARHGWNERWSASLDE